MNEKLSKEAYFERLREYDLRSALITNRLELQFQQQILKNALWRATWSEKCENSSGGYAANNKNCQNTYFVSESEDCVNFFRGITGRDILDVVGSGWGSELIYGSTLVMDNCRDVYCSFGLDRCVDVAYSGYLTRCKHCIGCCGLVGKEYHVFNRKVSPEDYHQQRTAILSHLEQEGRLWDFFPGAFAPSPYDETLAHFFFPLDGNTARALGFRENKTPPAQRSHDDLDVSFIPDLSSLASEDVTQKAYWDVNINKRFQISKHELKFCSSMGVPLSHEHYISTIKKLYRQLHFIGSLREAKDAKTSEDIPCIYPEGFSGQIVSDLD